jgi:hypothetical protein
MGAQGPVVSPSTWHESSMSILATRTTDEPVNCRPDTVHYREYKLLVRASHFSQPQQFQKFWKLTRRVADLAGVTIHKQGKPMETHLREIVFFDTAKFCFYNHGFMLRRRTFYKHGVPRRDHELTLKFRSADYAEAAAVDVRPLLVCDNEVKFKEEILPPRVGSPGMRTLYSHGCDLQTPDMTLTNSFETIAQVFPALQRTQAGQNSPLAIVNDLVIEEVLVNYGQIDFGGKVTAKANLAIWRNRMTQEPLLGEYAYQMKFPDGIEFHAEARKLSESFYVKLQEAAYEWIGVGTTKTAMVYSQGKAAITNHE